MLEFGFVALLGVIYLMFRSIYTGGIDGGYDGTLIDEYGDTGIRQPTVTYEVRRNSKGQLGPRVRDDRSYDERQIQQPVTDVSGVPLAE